MHQSHRSARNALIALLATSALAPAYAQQPAPVSDSEARAAQAAAMPTPRMATGVPDLSGNWYVNGSMNPAQFIAGGAVKADGHTVKPIAGPEIEEHQGNLARVAKRLANSAMRPEYKPPYAAKATRNFDRANFLDPSFSCQPLGVPRVGPPNEILQTPTTIFFLYQSHNIYRVIHVDGRPHDPDADRMPMGDSIGRWDGDTLIVDVTSLPDGDETWIDGDGSYHSKDLHVVERLTRLGNTIRYSVTSEDPIFARPFSPLVRVLLPGPAGEHVSEDYGCAERSLPHMVTTERH